MFVTGSLLEVHLHTLKSLSLLVLPKIHISFHHVRLLSYIIMSRWYSWTEEMLHVVMYETMQQLFHLFPVNEAEANSLVWKSRSQTWDKSTF